MIAYQLVSLFWCGCWFMLIPVLSIENPAAVDESDIPVEKKALSFMYGSADDYESIKVVEFGYLGKIQAQAPPMIVVALGSEKSYEVEAQDVKPGTQFIVEFYHPWCGACQAYREHYVKVAQEVQKKLDDGDTKVYFYAVSCEAYQQVCRDLSIQAYPMIRYFVVEQTDINLAAKQMNDKNNVTMDIGLINMGEDILYSNVDTDFLVDKLKNYTYHRNFKSTANDTNITSNIDEVSVTAEISVKEDSHKSNVANILPSTNRNATNGKGPSLAELLGDVEDVELQRDTFLSVLYTLEYSVFTKPGPLSEEKEIVLHAWLDLIHHATPKRWTTLHNLLRDLLSHHNEISQSFDKLKLHSTKQTPFVSEMSDVDSKWSDECARPPTMNGYTCGLWKVFHSVSVGVARGAYLDSANTVRIATNTAATTIRDFINTFFGCLECRQHFLTMFDDCTVFDRCVRLFDEAPYDDDPLWIEMTIYFWKVHNHVNQRLYREEMQRRGEAIPSEEIIMDLTQWPSTELCSRCRKADGSWNEKQVYLFLHRKYWYVSVRYTFYISKDHSV